MGPPTLSLHSQSHLFKVGTDHTVPSLKHHGGSVHGPQGLESCPACLSHPVSYLFPRGHTQLRPPWTFCPSIIPNLLLSPGLCPCCSFWWHTCSPVFTWPVSFCHSYFRKCHCLFSIPSSTCVTSSVTLLTSLCFTFLSGLLFTACLPLGCKLNNRDLSTQNSAQCIVDAQ